MTVQYRVIVGKKQEHVTGPDDASVVISIEAADCELDPTEAYMRGKLKVVGHTGQFLEALKSGEVERALRASRG